MISSEADNRTETEQFTQFHIDGRVKLDHLRSVRRELVLHVVGRGKVKEVSQTLFQKRNSGPQNVETGVGAVNRRRWSANDLFDVVDAVGLLADLVGSL